MSERNIDPKAFGERLVRLRKGRGKTQEEVADHLGLSRPTYIAIEKGVREPQPAEALALAELLGCPVHELVRPGLPARVDVHLRMALDTKAADAGEVEAAIEQLQRFADDYIRLETLLGAKLPTNYPPEVQLPAKGSLIDFAEDVAGRERARLQVGDQPIADLRSLLEAEVGLRIFYGGLPSRVAGLYAFVADLGCCVMVNQKHPRERQRASLAHEYGHVIADRHRPGIDYYQVEGNKPRNERFVEAFAMAFLMPATSIRRHFHDTYAASGDFQVADLIRLADRFGVSVQAMTYRLEGLGLIPRGTWQLLKEERLKVDEAKRELNLSEPPSCSPERPYPQRYCLMAVQAYVKGLITESQLAGFLRCDRVEAREIVEETKRQVADGDHGDDEVVELPITRSLLEGARGEA